MFTGIIEDIGRVKAVEKTGDSGKIEIISSLDLSQLPAGSSISVDGACLTIIDGQRSRTSFSADLSNETLSKTTFGKGLAAGRLVNIERPLTLDKPLGGHLVTGHVDTIGVIRKKVLRGAFLELELELPQALTGQVVKKGSIAIDGISLTVTEVSARGVGVAIIPHTLKKTTLPNKSIGGFVNIETDIIAKYVERALAGRGGGITEGLLQGHGFLR